MQEVLDIVTESDTAKLGMSSEKEMGKNLKDRHQSAHGSTVSCVHKIGLEQLEFLKEHGLIVSIYSVCLLVIMDFSGICDAAAQLKYFEDMLLQRTSEFKPTLLSLNDLPKKSQVVEVSMF